MIQRLGENAYSTKFSGAYSSGRVQTRNISQQVSTPITKTDISKLTNAYQAYYGINTAKTVSFGQGLREAFQELNQPMSTCRDLSKGMQGEKVGSRTDISNLINKYNDDLLYTNDAIKTDIMVAEDGDKITEARTQLKKKDDGILYEMAVRQPREKTEKADKSIPLTQLIKITQTPFSDERAYVLNTKGKLMAVIEDGENVILTNAGNITKDTDNSGKLNVRVSQKDNHFTPFTPEVQEVKEREIKPSVGKGTGGRKICS